LRDDIGAVAFARELHARKVARPAALIKLTPTEINWLKSTFEDPKVRYAELDQLMARDQLENQRECPTGKKWWESIDSTAEAQKALEQCRKMLAEIGIIVPNE
jgi:hypothetical protein